MERLKSVRGNSEIWYLHRVSNYGGRPSSPGIMAVAVSFSGPARNEIGNTDATLRVSLPVWVSPPRRVKRDAQSVERRVLLLCVTLYKRTS